MTPRIPKVRKYPTDKRAVRPVIIDFGFTGKEEERIADRAAQFGLTPDEYLRARSRVEP